jgi:hypothetical protein
MAINSLLFADDVALIGTATEVQAMLDIAGSHSLRLGYRWSPTKCAILNAEHSRFTLYGEPIPQVDEFVYLGIPFQKAGMSTEALIRYRTSSTIKAMSTLQAIGARPSGFSALLSSCLYRQFIRPKFEYALAVCRLNTADSKALEDLQNRCLRMMTGGHRTSSTVVFRHLCDLPSMTERALILGMKFCARLEDLPPDCLLVLLLPLTPAYGRLTFLQRNPLYRALPSPRPLLLKPYITAFRLERLMLDRVHPKKLLLQRCRPTLGIDPILTVPATRRERSRLIRWRMGWLPGKPKPCPCGQDHTSPRHLAQCFLLPPSLWECLPPPPPGTHPIDSALNQIPRPLRPAPSFWSALLLLLLKVEQFCLTEEMTHVEPPPGSYWLLRHLHPERASSPLL